MMNTTILIRSAVAVSITAAVALVAFTDARAATIREGTVKAELPPAEPPSFSFGDRVVWMDRDRGEMTVVVTRVKGGVVTWLNDKGCSWANYIASFQAPSPRWRNCRAGSGTHKVKRRGRSRLYPLEVGNTAKWSAQGKNKKGNTWSSTRSCEVRGTANVTVPAGSFDTYHVVCTDKWNRYQWYYSPELRFHVAFMRDPRRGREGGRTHEELVSYAPADLSRGTAATGPVSKRITTERDFLDLVAGKRIANEAGFVIAHEDGSLTGEFGKRRLSGTWTWQGRHYCRIAKLGNESLGLDCQTVVVSGDMATFTREKGKGKRSTWRLEEPES